MSEKREYPRLVCGCEAPLISNGFFRGRILDISEGGAQLEMPESLMLARDVLVRGPMGRSSILALADIRWSRVEEKVRRIGVKFLYLPVETRSRIRRMLDKRPQQVLAP